MARKSINDRTGEKRLSNSGLEMTIIAYRNSKDIDIQFQDGQIVHHKQYGTFSRGEIAHPDDKPKDRTGETNINNQKLNMTLIAYRNTKDIDVKFDDGSIAKHKEYIAFKLGNIAHPKPIGTEIIIDGKPFIIRNAQAIDHTGEKNTNSDGLEMEIVNYRSTRSLDVRFADGTIVKNRTYNSFKNGQIEHPNKKQERSPESRIGKTKINNQGLRMTVCAYRSSTDMDVIFDDKSIATNKTWHNFQKGVITHPKPIGSKINIDGKTVIIKNAQTIDRTGEKITNKDGLEMTIVAYRSRNDIAVKFPDGSISDHKSYGAFKEGKIAHPDKRKDKTPESRIGQTNMSNQGLLMTICGYKNNRDVDIKFPDGTIKRHCAYGEFKKGCIEHPKTGRNVTAKNRKNETKTNKQGLCMTITKYTNAKDVTVRFQDGTVIEHTTYAQFTKGTLRHPTLTSRTHGTLYNTQIFGIAHKDPNGNTCYYSHCPICQAHAIWTFETIKKHECNIKLAETG